MTWFLFGGRLDLRTLRYPFHCLQPNPTLEPSIHSAVDHYYHYTNNQVSTSGNSIPLSPEIDTKQIYPSNLMKRFILNAFDVILLIQ